MTHTLEIPIFPLGTVLYPAGRLPLRIFESRYVEMTRACIRDGSVFGVTLIRAGFEVGTPAIPSEIGCTARILEWEVPNPGPNSNPNPNPNPNQYLLMTQGETIFRIQERWTRADGLIMARVELQEPPDPMSLPERYDALASLLTELIEGVGHENFPKPHRFDDAAWVGNRLAELLPVEPERKQKLLEAGDPMIVLAEIERMIKQLRDDQ